MKNSISTANIFGWPRSFTCRKNTALSTPFSWFSCRISAKNPNASATDRWRSAQIRARIPSYPRDFGVHSSTNKLTPTVQSTIKLYCSWRANENPAKNDHTDFSFLASAAWNLLTKLRVESNDLPGARPAKQIDVSRQTPGAFEGGKPVQSPEVAHRIADALDRSPDDVFHYDSELSATYNDDGLMTITICFDDEPDCWKSDDVRRVTTRA